MTRERHVQEIKDRVQAGTYKVDPAAVVEAMIMDGKFCRDGARPDEDKVSMVRAMHYEGRTQAQISRETGLGQSTVYRYIAAHNRPACAVAR